MSGEANHDQFDAIVNERIYVFTPNGDIVDLSQHSTPLDFAYKVHTQVGHRCIGAKVNDKLVTLTHRLRTGDRIDIITSKTDNPSRDWLNLKLGYLTTKPAINKVKNFFRKQNQVSNITRGQALWEKAYRQHKLDQSKFNDLPMQFNLKTVDDLLMAIGSGEIQIGAILSKYNIRPVAKKDPTDTPPRVPITRMHHKRSLSLSSTLMAKPGY